MTTIIILFAAGSTTVLANRRPQEHNQTTGRN